MQQSQPKKGPVSASHDQQLEMPEPLAILASGEGIVTGEIFDDSEPAHLSVEPYVSDPKEDLHDLAAAVFADRNSKLLGLREPIEKPLEIPPQAQMVFGPSRQHRGWIIVGVADVVTALKRMLAWW